MAKQFPDYQLELTLGGRIAGVDEAGRGPLAGPVFAAAVILNPANIPAGLNDSKLLKAHERDALNALVRARAHVGIGSADVREIEMFNILGATKLAMQRAVAALTSLPDIVLVDGNQAPALPCPVRTVVRGDAISLSIAAASIVAKVARDAHMAMLALHYPGYGFEKHAGYGTPQHLEALTRLGACPAHRAGFAPVKRILEQHEPCAA